MHQEGSEEEQQLTPDHQHLQPAECQLCVVGGAYIETEHRRHEEQAPQRQVRQVFIFLLVLHHFI